MRKIASTLSALSALALMGCGAAPSAVSTQKAQKQQAIINGESCGPETEPTAVAIMLDATINFGQGPFDITQVMCTGTLIAPDVVMLAAHCTDPSLLTFGFGTVDRADYYVSFEADLSRYAESQEAQPLPESAIPVREVLAHPDFDINQLGQGTAGEESDIALLFLSTNVDDVRPEVVITAEEADQLVVGEPVTIAGWGQQEQSGGPFEAPPPGTVGIKMCGATSLDELGSTLMQIGKDPSSVRKCHGDSGGPTYTEVETSSSIKRRVIGVTSRAYDDQDCNKGGVDTRVDAYLDFLDEAMTARCDDGSRTFCDVPGLIPASFYEEEGGDDDGDDDGRGSGQDLALGQGCPGCAGTPLEVIGIALLPLLLRRRRR